MRKTSYKEALNDLTSSLESNPQYELALSQRAKLNLRMGRCGDSILDFHALGRLNPTHKDLGMREKAETCQGHTKNAEEGIVVGQLHVAKFGLFDCQINNSLSSRNQLDQAIALTDFSSPLLLRRAEILYSMGHFHGLCYLLLIVWLVDRECGWQADIGTQGVPCSA